MSIHVERTHVLLGQGRFKDAKDEILKHLGLVPEDGSAYAFLALCELNLGQPKEATAFAQNAITLAPDYAFAHYMLAQALHHRNRLAEAEKSVNEAIRLEPEEPLHFAALAAIRMSQRKFRDALAAADAGLALDPTDSRCLNQRASALVMLGRRAEAAATMAGALANSPDDSMTHANQGFALLHANDPRKAIHHFREALRINPENEHAKVGIVESLKARRFIYRLLLQYFFLVSRLPQSAQMVLLVAMLFGPGLLRKWGEKSPFTEMCVEIVIAAYLAFAAMTWLGNAAFNLMLRFDKDGRYALNDDQLQGANLLALYLIPPVLMMSGLALTGNHSFQWAAFRWMFVCMPAAAVFHCDKGWPRWTAFGLLLMLTAWCLGATWDAIMYPWVKGGTVPSVLVSQEWLAIPNWLAWHFFYPFIIVELSMLYLMRVTVRT
jgi:tetratricopeptide (TPR) repeat protein